MFTKSNLLSLLSSIFIFLADFYALYLSLSLTLYINIGDFATQIQSQKNYYWMIAVILFVMYLKKIYLVRDDFWSDVKKILESFWVAFLIIFFVFVLSNMSDKYSITMLTYFLVQSVFMVIIFKRYIKKLLFHFDFFKKKVYIIAEESHLELLQNELRDNWYLGYKESQNDFDILLISSKNLKIEKLQHYIRKYSTKTKDIYIIPYLYDIDFSHSEVVDYFNIRLSAIHIENRLLLKRNLFIKHIFEKTLVLLLFPMVLISHLFIALIIKLDSKGSIFYKQKRLGLNGRSYNIYKYRTMYNNSQNILDRYLIDNPEERDHYELFHKYKHDPRITKVGKLLRKTSLDEVPQFFNILRGDMNLIGPRPYMIEEEKKIGSENIKMILNVKPGITGLWQVSGRNELIFDERIELDKWYIKNWSLWMDFVIFIKTIKVLFTKVGAS